MAKTDLQILIDAVQELTDKSLTGTKPLVITDTTAWDDVKGLAVYAISDATFTTLNTSADGDTLVGQTLPAGHIWYLPILDIELAGGAVIVYRHTNA